MKKIFILLLGLFVFSCASKEKTTNSYKRYLGYSAENTASINEATLEAKATDKILDEFYRITDEHKGYDVIAYYKDKYVSSRFLASDETEYSTIRKIIISNEIGNNKKTFYINNSRRTILVTELNYVDGVPHEYTYIFDDFNILFYLKAPLSKITGRQLSKREFTTMNVEATDNEFVKKKVELNQLWRRVVMPFFSYYVYD